MPSLLPRVHVFSQRQGWEAHWLGFSLHCFRRMRGHCGTEWHSHKGTRYLAYRVARPDRHCWWAHSLYLYLPHKKEA